ncbi:MAG: PAS domain S-box protein [Actinomycetota bacterium]|nr:PAS domain S-box protein [Actinomycetota bacterium]
MTQNDSPRHPLLPTLERLPTSVVISSTATGIILWTNAYNLSVIGTTDPNDIIGRNLLDFLPPEQHGVALRDIEAMARGERKVESVVYRLRRLDGGTSYVHISSVPIRFEGVPAMLSLVFDVSDREKALRRLQESEERYRSLVDNSPDCVMVCQGDIVKYVNPTTVRVFRAGSAEDICGRSLFDFVKPDFRAIARTRQKAMYRTGRSSPPVVLGLVRLDGTCFPGEARSSVITWDDERATQTVIRDVDGLMDVDVGCSE